MEILITTCTILFLLFYYLNKKATLIANYLNLFDKPNQRKIQKQKIPLIGGLLLWIFFGLFLGVSILINSENLIFLKFFLFSSLFFLVGIIDDKFNLNPNLRLILLFITSSFLYKILDLQFISSIFIDDYGLVHIKYINIILTIFCILLFQNAMNMIDGLNGLSSSLFIGVLLFILFKNKTFDSFLIINFLVLILIFMYFNLNNKIFLGDSGVYFVASLCAIIIIHLSQNQTNLSANSIFLIMILPGIDMFRLFIERSINKKNPFKADKNHLHHHLIKNGSLYLTLIIILSLGYIPILAYEILNLNSYIIIFLFLFFYFIFLKKN